MAIARNGPMANITITLSYWDRLADQIYAAHKHIEKPSPDILPKADTQADVSVEDAAVMNNAARGAERRAFGGSRCIARPPR